MCLKELKRLVDFYVNQNPDANVVVTLKEPSIGGRACTSVNNVFLGFDWEHNQFRIEPNDALVRENRTRDIPQGIIQTKVGNRTYHFCSHCGGSHPVKKTDKFCGRCGQALDFNNIKFLNI